MGLRFSVWGGQDLLIMALIGKRGTYRWDEGILRIGVSILAAIEAFDLICHNLLDNYESFNY
jgi:hypothetical protein